MGFCLHEIIPVIIHRRLIFRQHTKDKIDVDYFTCNVIEWGFSLQSVETSLQTAQKNKI